MGLPRCFAGMRTRRARQHARRNIKLRDVGISAKTQERYYLAVSKVYKVIQNCCNTAEMDEKIADWIETVFHTGAPLNIVSDGLSGLHYFLPQTRRKLSMSWKLFGIWRRLEVPSRAPPSTEDICWAMISRCLQKGDFSMASLLGLGFDCFLRTGELLAIRPCDLLLRGSSGIVTLPTSKGQTRHHMKESVTIESITLIDILQETLLVKQSQGLTKVPFWTKNGEAFRKEFASLCAFFKVNHLNFRCYSLRRGGATAFFTGRLLVYFFYLI